MGDIKIGKPEGFTLTPASIKKAISDIDFGKDTASIGDNRPSADIHTKREKMLKAAAAKGKTTFTLDDISEYLHSSGDTKTANKLKKAKADMEVMTDYMAGDKGFHETLSNKDINQTKFQKDLIGKLGSKARIQNQQDVSKLNGRIPTIAELNDEFKKLASDKTIPFEYIVDGCYARAHLMCEQMMEDGINCGKMFTMIEDLNGGMLTAQNKFMNAEWWYHVAPLVFAEDPKTKEVQGFIMDPSMADHPMKAEEWIDKMWDNKINIKVDITRAPQYGPVESDGENNTFEESLNDSKAVLKDYSKTLAKIKKDYYAHHPNETPKNKHTETA